MVGHNQHRLAARRQFRRNYARRGQQPDQWQLDRLDKGHAQPVNGPRPGPARINVASWFGYRFRICAVSSYNSVKTSACRIFANEFIGSNFTIILSRYPYHSVILSGAQRSRRTCVLLFSPCPIHSAFLSGMGGNRCRPRHQPAQLAQRARLIQIQRNAQPLLQRRRQLHPAQAVQQQILAQPLFVAHPARPLAGDLGNQLEQPIP